MFEKLKAFCDSFLDAGLPGFDLEKELADLYDYKLTY